MTKGAWLWLVCKGLTRLYVGVLKGEATTASYLEINKTTVKERFHHYLHVTYDMNSALVFDFNKEQPVEMIHLDDLKKEEIRFSNHNLCQLHYY